MLWPSARPPDKGELAVSLRTPASFSEAVCWIA
jgi:hypothetical protein